MNENALSGENICDSIEGRELLPPAPDITANVLMMASFAVKPARMADAARQSPKPNGAKNGAADLPSIARRLSSLFVTISISLLNDCRNHTMTDAMKITVKAFLINPTTFCQTTCITIFRSGNI